MTLLGLLLVLVLLGVALYLFNTLFTTIDARIKRIINVLVLTVVGLLVLFWLFAFFGIDTGFNYPGIHRRI